MSFGISLHEGWLRAAPASAQRRAANILHEGVVRHAGPGHVTDGLVGQNKGGGEVTEREGQNHGQTPDTDDDTRGGLR